MSTAATVLAASVAPAGMVTAAATLVRLMPVAAAFLSRSVRVVAPATPLRLSAVPVVVVSVRVVPAVRLIVPPAVALNAVLAPGGAAASPLKLILAPLLVARVIPRPPSGAAPLKGARPPGWLGAPPPPAAG